MLDDTVAIVTGGSTGIGRAVAERYVAEGATVVIANRSRDAGERAAAEIGCEFHACDVAVPEEVEELVADTVDSRGRLDAMVNNAGVGGVGRVGDLDFADWNRLLDINLSGVMHGTRAALPHLLESEGAIVNVASIYGLVGGPGAAAYSAAKGGVVNLTRQVAVDYASEGVRVNSVCPGFVDTPMTEDYLDQDEFYEFVRDETPMNRVAEPDEIAGIVAFLASDDASYITGANIPVDGGWTAH